MISIILPTYNEVENIKVIIPELLMLFERENMEGEIIVIDDNSPDGTAYMAMKYVGENPVKVFVRKGDRGLSKSVIKGFELAQGNICLVMDADLSHPIKKIPAMIMPILNDECDLVVGSRYLKGGGWQNFSILREGISKIAGFMARGVTNLSDPTSGFMAVRKSIIDGVNLDPTGWKIVLETAVKTDPRIKEVPIRFSDRKQGKSKLGFKTQVDYIHHLWRLYSFKFPIIFQFIKFCLVGISGLILDTVILIGLVEIFSFDPRVAAIFSFLLAVSWNYFLNRTWTFENGIKTKLYHTYILFVFICTIGLSIRICVMHILIKYAGMGERPWYILASIFGISAATIFNFICNRLLTFSKLFFRSS